jgi:hypothetical protein
MEKSAILCVASERLLIQISFMTKEPKMSPTEKLSHMRGSILTIDAAARSLTIKSLVLNKTFQLADDVEIAATAKKAAFKDLKVGQVVDVYYEQHDTICLVHRIVQSVEQEQRKAA